MLLRSKSKIITKPQKKISRLWIALSIFQHVVVVMQTLTACKKRSSEITLQNLRTIRYRTERTTKFCDNNYSFTTYGNTVSTMCRTFWLFSRSVLKTKIADTTGNCKNTLSRFLHDDDDTTIIQREYFNKIWSCHFRLIYNVSWYYSVERNISAVLNLWSTAYPSLCGLYKSEKIA